MMVYLMNVLLLVVIAYFLARTISIVQSIKADKQTRKQLMEAQEILREMRENNHRSVFASELAGIAGFAMASRRAEEKKQENGGAEAKEE